MPQVMPRRPRVLRNVRGGGGERRIAEAACRIVWSTCPFRLECVIGGLERQELWGIWGGMDCQDRKRIAANTGICYPVSRPTRHERAPGEAELRLRRMPGEAYADVDRRASRHDTESR
jgi:hypothetical protein